MRNTFTLNITFNPLISADTRERALRAMVCINNPIIFTGPESMSKNRLDIKVVPRMKVTTVHDRATYRDRRYMRNDFRGKISSRA